MRRSRLAILVLFVFVDLLGYSLFLPLLPFFARDLGSNPIAVGLLISSNAITQFLATPVFGRLSDRYGRRPLLIISVSGTIISFVLLALSGSYGMLLFSRLLDGLLGGDISLARAYIVDVTDEKSRAKGLGMIGAAFGLGFIIGPVMGGVLSNAAGLTNLMASWGLSRFAAPALVAALLATINLLLVLFLLPESLTSEKRAELRASTSTGFTLSALSEALRRPCVGILLNVRFYYGLAFGLFTANFALYADYRLGLTDRETSYILTYVGLVIVLIQAFAIGRLTSRFRDRTLLYGGLLMLTFGLLAWALVPNVGLLLVVMAPLALSSGLLNTIANSALTKAVPPEEVGGMLGISASLDSLTRILAPLLGGVLLNGLGAPAIGFVASAIALGLFFATRRQLARHSQDQLPGCGWAETEIAD